MADDETPTTTPPAEPPSGAPADTPDTPGEDGAPQTAKKAPAKKAAAKKTPAKKAPAKRTSTAKKAPAKTEGDPLLEGLDLPEATTDSAEVDAAVEALGADPAAEPAAEDTGGPAKKKAAAKKTASAPRKTAAKKSTAKKSEPVPDPSAPDSEATEPEVDETAPATDAPAESGTAVLFQPPTTRTTTRSRRTRTTTVVPAAGTTEPEPAAEPAVAADEAGDEPEGQRTGKKSGKKSGKKTDKTDKTEEPAAEEAEEPTDDDDADADVQDDSRDSQDDRDGDEGDESGGADGGPRRRRRRGGRRRRKSGDSAESGDTGDEAEDAGESRGSGDEQGGRNGGRNGQGGRPAKGGSEAKSEKSDKSDKSEQSGGASDDGEDGEGTTRRRRRRRREGDDGSGGGDDPQNTVTRVRKPRSAEDEITAVAGSTRLEAKKQRRREGREAGRRRAPIVSEAEFLARRESVDRVMVVRQRDELTQIGVLEDKVLVEHYVARESQTSLIGNVYLGRVQNVLPSMEAAFIDIGKGRNAVLYAGEVNWSALGHKEGSPRKIESVLSSGQSVLVQVTKDPVGHKGARLTSQISLAGRFLVYVPDGTTSGISRKLPDTERTRLKTLLKEIVPDSAGVIVRTAAEGAAEDELTQDVERLKARWEDIEAKSRGGAPKLLYGEPDLTLKVVRDLFTEDFSLLVVQGEDAWNTVHGYVEEVAPDLAGRLERYSDDGDVFRAYRIDEQIAKALDRKVWLPSGGSLIIDRTEAMTVVDVNTGKFTGSGGNLEETVTKNNLEAAEEVVRQLRLRDIGGIIVVDFIDMVLESNRDLVLRRMVECLGRDRTRHQVAEVTSLGLVQMTRKRIGTGLLEAFSENCTHCQGTGLVVHDMPVEPAKADDEQRRGGGRRGGGGGGNNGGGGGGNGGGGNSGGRGGRGGRGQGEEQAAPSSPPKPPSPKDVAAMAKPPKADDTAADQPDEQPTEQSTESAPSSDTTGSTPEVPAPVSDQVEEEAPLTQQGEDLAPVLAEAEVTPAVSEPVTEPAPEPAIEPVAEPAPAISSAPRVSTRTRRSASRPAGTPVTASSEPVVPITVPSTPAASATTDGTAGTDGTAPADGVALSTPEPPKVVTRTRGRSASRPAGPPADAVDGQAADAGSDGSDNSVEHVPVKKKGTRKR